MAEITREDILKLASLSRISLTEEEISEFTEELPKIVDYIDVLSEVDVDGLLPTSQVTGLSNITRPDVVLDYGYTTDDMLKNAPKTEGGYIKTKRMIG